MVARSEAGMTDPTEFVLTFAFVAAIGVAAAGAMRRVREARSLPVEEPPAVLPSSVDAPFDPPRQSPPPLPPGPGAGVPVGFYRAYDLLGVAFVFLVFAGLAMSAPAAGESTSAINPQSLVFSIVFQFMMAGIVLAFVVRRVSPVEWLGLRWRAWPWVLVIAPCAVLAMWAVFGGLHYSGYVEWMESLGVETVQDTVRLLQDSEDPLVLGLMAGAAVLAAPLCEEIVFRGYFYPVLKRFAGAWPAAIASSLVFACAHGNLTAALPLFLFGALLVLLYEKTGSLWAPIAVHFCFNGATVVVQFASRVLGIPIDGNP